MAVKVFQKITCFVRSKKGKRVDVFGEQILSTSRSFHKAQTQIQSVKAELGVGGGRERVPGVREGF